MPKYPVSIIRDEYITKGYSLKELSIKYNLKNHRYLEVYSAKENWPQKRKEFIGKLSEKVQEKQLEKEANEPFNLIKSLEKLVEKKAQAEMLMMNDSLNADTKLRAYLINKSKDGLSDLVKTAELLKGNATDRTEIKEDEAIFRIERLNRIKQSLSAKENNKQD